MIKLLANLLWISPLWAWAIAAAVGIPLLAHLLNRRRYRTIVFPAVELLREAVIRTTRIRRPRHLLLLLLRTLALALVVLGFMRPLWQNDAVAQPPSDGQVLVIVLDASASMQKTTDGRAAFDQARDRAMDLIDQLEPGRDRASVYLLTDGLSPLLPEPTGNLSELRRRLAAAQCTWQADRTGQVGQVIVDRAAGDGVSRVAWISDGQNESAVARIGQVLEANVSGVLFQHMVVGQPVGNTSVHLQQVRPYPPTANQPVSVTVRVRHAGETAVERTLVMGFNDQTVRRKLTLAPGADQLVTLATSAMSQQPGWLNIGFEQPDRFEHDDRTGILLRPLATRSVILLTRETQGQSGKRIRAMLNPQTPGPGTDAPNNMAFREFASGQALDAAGLDPSATLVIFGRQAIPEDQQQVITTHLERGGGVVWFADTAASRQALADRSGPLRFSRESADATDVEQTQANFELDELRVFEGPARGMLVKTRWPAVHDAQLSDTARSLIAGPDGRPIVAGHTVGRGTLYVINADVGAEDHALTLDPAFVVLFAELVRLAPAGEAMPPSLHPGQIDTTAEGGAAVEQVGPTASGRWVELDPRECDLFNRGDDASTPQASATSTAAGASNSSDALLAHGTPLWPFLLLGAIALFAVEAGVLIRYGIVDERGGGR